MASEAELADMFLTLRAVNAPLLEGFGQVSAAGEEMTAAINASLAEVDAAIVRTAESLQALRDSMAEVSAGAGSIGATSAGTAAVAATSAGTEAAGAGATAAAGAGAAGAGMSAAEAEEAALEAEIQAGYDRIATVMAKISADADAAAANWNADFAKMAADTIALSDGMDAAAAKVDAAWADMAASEAAYDAKAAATAAATPSKFAAFSGSMLKVGAAGAIAGGAVVDMAAKFESSTTRLVTSGGEAADNLQKDQQGILALAGQVGYSAGDLSSAMYKITSSGQQGAQALNTLKAAAQGAKTENADLTTVADAVSTAMIDYKNEGLSAADVTSKLVAATSQGKTNFQDLAGSMAAILPRASTAHISFSEILGDLASMTQHGESAQQSAQNLADAISHMQKPTMAQSKEMAALGLNSTQLSQDLGKNGLSGTITQISDAITNRMGKGANAVILHMQDALKGLPKPVQDLSQQVLNGTATWTDWNKATKDLTVTQKSQAQAFATLVNGMHTIGTEQMTGGQAMQTYAGAMQQAMGTSAGLNVALMLTGQNSGNTSKAISTVSQATADAQGNVEGWSKIQGTFNQKLSEAKDGLGAAAIAVGQKLLPPVTAIVGKLASFASWLSQNKVAATALAGVIGMLLLGGLIGVIGKLATLGLSMASNIIKPFTGSIGLIRNFAGGLKGAEGAVGTFGGKLGSAASTIGGWMSSLGQAIASGAKWAGSLIAQGAQVAAGATRSAATATGAWIASVSKQVATNASQAATWAAGMVRQYTAAAAAATKQAAVASAAWLAATAKMLAQGIAQAVTWVAGMIAKFTMVAVSAVVEATATAAAWIAANAAMIVATGGIILLLGLVVTAAIYLATHWSQVWNGIKEVAAAIWHWIDSNIVQPIVTIWNALIVPALHYFGQQWDALWNGIKATISAIWNGFLKPIFDGISNAISTVVHAVGGFISTVGNIAGTVGKFLGFDEGGWVPGSAGQPRLAIVHGGEYVLSRDMLSGRAMPDVPLSSERGSASGVAPMFGSGGGSPVTVVHMPISVGGSVVTDSNLTDALQKAFLRLSSRNVGFGTNVAFS